MKKRVLSLLLAVCLCVGLLPVTALAADVTWVYFAGSSKEYAGGIDGMTYNPYKNTLTLTNAAITDSRDSLEPTLRSDGPLTITLVGDSTITLSGKVPTAISVQSGDSQPAEASLTITGSGSLTIDMTEASVSGVKGDICGILISNGNLSIEDGVTVKIIGKETSGGNNYGISVGGDVTVGEGCKLEAAAGAATGGSAGEAKSYGVYAEGNVTVNRGGELTANGGAATYGGCAASYGVYAEGALTVSGKLEANSGAATSTQDRASSFGVHAGGSVTVSGENAELTARSLDPENGAAATSAASNAGAGSYGMRVEGNLTLSGGAHVTAQGGTAAATGGGTATNYGLYVAGDHEISVKDAGTTLIATGGAASPNKGGSSDIRSIGIDHRGTMKIQGGHVEAYGGSACRSIGFGTDGSLSGGITLDGGSLTATASDRAASSFGVETKAVTINSGSAVFTGKHGGILAESLTIGAEEGYVDVQATATGGPDAWAAICVKKNSLSPVEPEDPEDPVIDPDTVTLTNVEILTPEGGTHGRVRASDGTPLETILETDGTAAKTVHISNLPKEGAEGGFLPGLFLPLLTGALEEEAFDDVAAGDWFYGDVNYVNKYKLMTGTSARKFSPNAPVTRGMVMTILARREGVKTRYEPWYAAGCAWAQAAGISDGTNPEDLITREQLAVMLYRYAVYAGLDVSVGAETNILSFLDALEISDYAFEGLSWAVGSGIMSGAAGVDAGKLLPQATATRAQLAAMLHRFFG